MKISPGLELKEVETKKRKNKSGTMGHDFDENEFSLESVLSSFVNEIFFIFLDAWWLK